MAKTESSGNKNDQLGSMFVPEFCAWASIGRTAAYAEIKAGRLRAKKCGSRTIITFDDAERRTWCRARNSGTG
jgi:hypothetical protein